MNGELLDTLRPLAAEAVQHLDGFSVVELADVNHALVLRHTDGRELFARIDYRNKDRVILTGHYPRDWSGPYERVEITVATSRSGKALAAEVTRRLLPTVTKNFESYAAWLISEEARKSGLDKFLGEARAALPAVTRDTRNDHRFYTDMPGHSSVHFQLNAACTEAWELTIRHVPRELLLQMLQLIRDHKEAR